MSWNILLWVMTLVASVIGTTTGFGTSTVMMPVLILFMPVSEALVFVGIIHLCGDIWKVALFRRGLLWSLVLGFGIPGIITSFIGASMVDYAPPLPFRRVLGGFLLAYVVFLLIKRDWSMPRSTATAVSGGLLSGFFAGLFGVGGAVRGAFLAAFDLPKEVYIFTSGLIALCIDVTRVSRYLWGGAVIGTDLFYPLLGAVPISLAGAFVSKRFLARLPRRSFRFLVAFFLAAVGLLLVSGRG